MAVEQAVPGALDPQEPDTEDARALAGALAADETQLLYSMVLHGRAELNLMSDEYAAMTMVLLRFLAFPAQGAESGARAAEAPREPRSAPAARAGAAGDGGAAAHRAFARPCLGHAHPPIRFRPRARLGAGAAPCGGTDAGVASPCFGGRAHPVGRPPHLAERWNHALVRSRSRTGRGAALLRELAQQAGLQGIDDSRTPPVWHLRVEREPLRSAALADKLAAAIGTAIGQPVQVRFESGIPDDSPARRDIAARLHRQAQAEETIHNDPVVRELLNQFKTARIVPGSIKPV